VFAAQSVPGLSQVRGKRQLIELRPQGLFTSTIKVLTEASILEEPVKIVFANRLAESNE
jgi:hypothetical protein